MEPAQGTQASCHDVWSLGPFCAVLAFDVSLPVATAGTTPTPDAAYWEPRVKVAVFGPGAVGGYLALCLSAAGIEVKLIGRESRHMPSEPLSAAVTARGRNVRPRQPLSIHHFAQAAKDCEVALVAVKSADTRGLASVLRRVLRPESLVVSFQNGLANPGWLRAALSQKVAAGVVAFNVVSAGGVRYQTTRGKLFIERVDHPAWSGLVSGFASGGQKIQGTGQIESLMAGKLLLNLHNGVSAATGLATWETLMDDATRRCYVACLREGLGVLRAADLRPRSAVPLPIELLILGLSLPSAYLRPFVRAALSRQATATSSTLLDLRAKRRTEIDQLNGAIVQIAAKRGGTAPINSTVCEVVRELEAQAELRFLTGCELERRIARAVREGGRPLET